MNLSDQKDLDVLLVKVSAMALLTFALLMIPGAFGAAIQVASYPIMDPTKEYDRVEALSEFVRNAQMQLTVAAIGKIASCIVLLFLSLWMFSYPPIIRKALSRTSSSPQDSSLP